MLTELSSLALRYRLCEAMPEMQWIDPLYREVAKLDFSFQCLTCVEQNIERLVRDGRALILAGGLGCGKTQAAYYAAAAMLVLSDVIHRQIITPSVYNAGALMDTSFEVMEWHYAKYLTPYMCIDDLGAEFMSDKGWQLSKITELLDYRYTHKLPTVMTTNLQFKGGEFAARYGARLTDRLREWGTVVTISDPSFRGT